MVNKYKIIFLIKPSRFFLEHFGFSSLNLVDFFRTLWIFKLKTLG